MMISRSIIMDSLTWTLLGKIADMEFDKNINEAIETLCKEALEERIDQKDIEKKLRKMNETN